MLLVQTTGLSLLWLLSASTLVWRPGCWRAPRLCVVPYIKACPCGCRLEEEDYRGERYANHHKELKGNNDLLVITKPQVPPPPPLRFQPCCTTCTRPDPFFNSTMPQSKGRSCLQLWRNDYRHALMPSAAAAQVIEEIHTAFLEAGADILETNTFNGTTISQGDYELDIAEEVGRICEALLTRD